MKKFLSITMAVLFALGVFIAPPTHAQQVVGPEQFGFAFAADYGKWGATSAGDVSTGAVVITMRDPNMGQATTPDGRNFRPFATNAPVLIDAGGANPETLTPSAISCAAGGLTCAISVTTIYAHTGNFTIQSGTYGLAEAYNACINSPAGKGTVLIGNGWSGTTTTITTTFPAGSSSVNILDVRNGVFQFYTSSGSTYAASLSPFNTTTAAGATVTTATGAAFFYAALNQATNHGIADLALGANTSGAALDFLKTRTTNADGRATTAVVTADNLASVNVFGADGTNYIGGAAMSVNAVGTIAAARVPTQIVFKTETDAASSVLTSVLTLDQNQSSIFGLSSTLDATVTAQAPVPRVIAISAPGTNAEMAVAAIGATATGNQVVAFKTRSATTSAPATTTVVTADDELLIRAFGADGVNYVESSQIQMTTGGTIASTRVPGKIVFKTGTDAAPTVLTTALTLDKDQSTTAAGTLKANGSSSGTNTAIVVDGINTYVEVTADFAASSASNTPITGLAWTMPLSQAINYPFHCVLTWTQATAATANAFTITTATNAPTNGSLNGLSSTAATAVVRNSTTGYNATSATTIVTATPGAAATTEQVFLDGFIEQPSSGSTSAVTIGITTTTGNTDVTTIKRGSYCRLF